MAINCLQILVLAAVLTTTLGVPFKRQSDNNCLFQYVTQPLKTTFNTCNPFTPAENSLTLECSILVRDSREGELTINWIYIDSRDVTNILTPTITAIRTSPETIITSNITVCTQNIYSIKYIKKIRIKFEHFMSCAKYQLASACVLNCKVKYYKYVCMVCTHADRDNQSRKILLSA